MKFIKDVLDLVEFLAGKNIATKQPPEKLELILYDVSCDLQNQYIDHYAKTEKVVQELRPFLRQKPVVLTNGIGPLPEDFQFVREVQLNDGTHADLVYDPFWSKRVNSKVRPPSLTRPIARIEDQGVEPQQLALELNVGADAVPASLKLFYFCRVIRPKYAYSLSGTRYVYDDNASIDLQWDQLLFTEIKLRTLNALGINLREQQVTAYTEQMKREEGLK